MKQGIKEGIKEGKEEALVSIIKSMIREKTDFEFISKVTGKSLEEVKKISLSLDE